MEVFAFVGSKRGRKVINLLLHDSKYMRTWKFIINGLKWCKENWLYGVRVLGNMQITYWHACNSWLNILMSLFVGGKLSNAGILLSGWLISSEFRHPQETWKKTLKCWWIVSCVWVGINFYFCKIFIRLSTYHIFLSFEKSSLISLFSFSCIFIIIFSNLPEPPFGGWGLDRCI